MNHWIGRNHKRQQDNIISFLKLISSFVNIGNVYTRDTHTIEVICNQTSIILLRIDTQWTIRGCNFDTKLDDYGTPEFWNVIRSCIQHYTKPPIEFIDD